MCDRMLRATALAVLVAVVPSCGGDGSAAAPTPTLYETSSAADFSGVAPLSWTCSEFYSEAGPVTASVAPETSVELSMNGCATADTPVLGQGDKGFAIATMAAGVKRVRFYNGSTATGTFHVALTYTLSR